MKANMAEAVMAKDKKLRQELETIRKHGWNHARYLVMNAVL
jgi:hypothetical protein